VILYDGECALCNRSVGFIQQRDKRHRFTFKPGAPEDTLVLRCSDGREWRYGKGALRILWLLGGWWRVPGLLSFLPRHLVDGPYRWIATRRH
jgi:predicted DCC family thiol-disulfide oxidoreductase YuxK